MKMGQILKGQEGKIECRRMSASVRSAIDCIFVALTLAVFFTGCKHTQGKFASLNEPTTTELAATAPATSATAPTAVTISRQIDPAWLKPSPDLFTLGPGDRLEIEVIGDPASRSVTIVAPD